MEPVASVRRPGDIERLQALDTRLQRREALDDYIADKNNTLLLAVKYNFARVVEWLLDNGADVNFRRASDGSTALIQAVKYQHEDVVLALLAQHGIDPNAARATDGLTALMLAVRHGNYAMMASLLDHGVDLEFESSVTRRTALTIALERHDGQAVLLLLGHGVFADIIRGDEPLLHALVFQAIASGYLEAVQALFRLGVSQDITHPVSGFSLITYAANFGHHDLVGYLIERGMDVNATDRCGRTVLTIAAEKGYYFLVRFLVNGGAVEVDKPGQLGNTALMLAASIARVDMVQLLLTHGADVSEENNKEQTALLLATKNGCLEIVRIILTAGADVNSTDESGDTALIVAVKNADEAMLSLVLEFHPAVDHQNDEGKSALMIALDRRDRRMLHWLIEHDVDVDQALPNGQTLLTSSIVNNDISMLELLLEFGANLNRIDNNGQIPFVLAVQQGNRHIINLLLDHQPSLDINQMDRSGQTALMVAAQGGHADIVRFLLAKGANVNYRDSSGHVAMTFAANQNVRLALRGKDYATNRYKLFTVALPMEVVGEVFSIFTPETIQLALFKGSAIVFMTAFISAILFRSQVPSFPREAIVFMLGGLGHYLLKAPLSNFALQQAIYSVLKFTAYKYCLQNKIAVWLIPLTALLINSLDLLRKIMRFEEFDDGMLRILFPLLVVLPFVQLASSFFALKLAGILADRKPLALWPATDRHACLTIPN